MANGSDSRARDALLRLLADASSSPEARVDALVALSQRTLFVATWEPLSPSYRTLEQGDGRTALPVFTDEWELDHAATELDWNRNGARVGRVEIGAREALRKVIDDKLDCLVVDLAARHSMEAQRAEIEPLAMARTRSDSQGAFAAVGRISSTMLEAVRASQTATPPASPTLARVSTPPPPGVALPIRTPPPPAPERRIRTPFPQPPAPLVQQVQHVSVPPAPRLPTSVLPPPPVAQLSPGLPVSDATAKLLPVQEEPIDAMLDSLIAVMRNFPEVEWAAYGMVSVAEAPARPMIVVRVDPSYRQRTGEIASGVAGASSTFGSALDMLLIDRADLIKAARFECITFFPWKRRKTGGMPPVVA